jgi:hypothetical protein
MVFDEGIDDRHVGAVAADHSQGVVGMVAQLNCQMAEMIPGPGNVDFGIDSGLSQSSPDFWNLVTCSAAMCCWIDDHGECHCISIRRPGRSVIPAA